MKVNYSQLPGITTKIVLVPLIPVTFMYKHDELSTFALVDSGAMGGVVSTIIADELSIRWRNIPVIQGFSVGGLFRSHRVENFQAIIFNHSFTLNLNVVEGISPYRCILGQADLFHHAKITFEEYKKQFDIEFRRYN